MKNRALSSLSLFVAIALLMAAFPLPAQATDAKDAGDQQFTTVIDDLPLMPGLTTVEGNDVLFVEPHEGRIAETEASGAVAVDEVYNFYRHSLPHLGWQVVDGHTYVRDGEKLLIDAHAESGVTTVRFSVKPAS